MGQFILPVLSLGCLIAINAFFTAAEFSIVAVRRSRISQLAKSGDLQAQTVQSFQRGIDRLLSTTQLGITLSSLALGWIGEQTLAVAIARLVSRLPFSETVAIASSHSLAISLSFFCLAYLQIVFGELIPKSLALIYPEQLARFFAPPSLVIAQSFRPFVSVLNVSTKLILKAFRIDNTQQLWREQLTAEELQLMIDAERGTSDLEDTQRKLINNAIEFGYATAGEITIPRGQIEFLSVDATFAQLLTKIAATNYFRFPIIGESIDDIKGIIDYKSLARPLATGELTDESLVINWAQPALFIDENKPVKELLSQMQQKQQAMAIVIDSYGGTSGLITLQDLIMEIVGNLNEHNSLSESDYYQPIDTTTAIVSAQMNIENLNQKLGLELPATEGYHTLSGFLQQQSQSIPQQNDVVEYQNIKFKIIKTDNNRLQFVEVKQSAEISVETPDG